MSSPGATTNRFVSDSVDGITFGDRESPDTDTPDSARLEACLVVLLGAESEQEFAQAKEQVRKIQALSDEEVMALQTQEG